MEYHETVGNTTTSWTEIYCPKTIQEIIGNDRSVKSIISWINSFEENGKNHSKQKKTKRKIKIKIKDDDLVDDDIGLAGPILLIESSLV